MFIVLKCAHVVYDGGDSTARPTIPAGRHEIERVNNPLHKGGDKWLVLKGTLVGKTEGAWRHRGGLMWDDDEVVIEK